MMDDVRVWLLSILSLVSTGAQALPTRVLVHNEWALMSIPADPGSPATVQSVFGDDLPVAEFGTKWALFSYPPPPPGVTTRTYVALTLGSTLEPGMGYWMIQMTNSDVTIDLPAAAGSAASSKAAGCSSVAGCTSIPLGSDSDGLFWNMVGLPRDTPISFDSTRTQVTSGPCAPACSPDEAEANNIMHNQMFSYSAASGYAIVEGTDQLEPWEGFWAASLPGAVGENPAWLVPQPLPQPALPDLSNHTLAFSDEFDGPTLNAAKWNTGFLWGPYIPINAEKQLYVDTLGLNSVPGYTVNHNPFVFEQYPSGERTLKIVAEPVSGSQPAPAMPPVGSPLFKDYLEYRHNPDYNPADVDYLSGILASYESFKFTHGYAEARVKVPAGQGLWPAFWLLNTHYVENNPEIDIMEALGQNRHVVHHTYHHFLPGVGTVSSPTYDTVGPDFSEDFHTFGMSWEPKQIIWYVDGMETRRVTNSDYKISGQAMYVLANLAVGGNWPGDPDATTEFPAEYEIDYIRVYKRDVAVPVNLADYQLMFQDNFNGASLDPLKWNTRFLWGPWLLINNEEQYYVDANGLDTGAGYSPFAVSGGNLTITAQASSLSPSSVPSAQPPAIDPLFASVNFGHTSNLNPPVTYTPPPYTSGIITSYDAFKFAHGYAEIRAKIPQGDGLWPAFWLLNAYYIGNLPEIDVMEILGEEPGKLYHTFHFNGPSGMESRQFITNGGSASEGYADDFHTYGVQWRPGSITWYVDGSAVHTLNDPNVAYQIMYVIANLAVGGDFNTQPVDPAALPAEFVIDYIRVYQEKGSS